MWTYLVWLGLGMLVDPVRIGIAAIMMSRRQALRSLLAFWVGGIVAGLTVGIAVLVLLHDFALVAITAAIASVNDLRSAVVFLTGEHLRITLGVLSLVGLGVMLAKDRAKMKIPVSVGGAADMPERLPLHRRINIFSTLAARTHGMLESGFVWPAFVVGLLSTFPPIEGPMALTVIMGSRATAGIQFSAFMLFTVLVLVFIEVPLLFCLAAPEKTQAVMLQANTWITAHRRQIMETLLAVMGTLSLVQGVINL